MNYEEEMLYSSKRPERSWLPVIVFSLTLSIIFYIAYQSGVLPHYTLMIDGNKWEWVRDDPAHLAKQEKIMTQQEIDDRAQIARNRALLSASGQRQELIEIEPIDTVQVQPEVQQQQVAEQIRPGIQKCLTTSKRIVYQEQPCSSNGMTTAKALTSADLTDSTSDAQPVTQQISEVSAPRVAVISPSTEKKNTPHCRNLSDYRDNIRSQQRVRSTQYLRDEYDRISKQWQSECLG